MTRDAFRCVNACNTWVSQFMVCFSISNTASASSLIQRLLGSGGGVGSGQREGLLGGGGGGGVVGSDEELLEVGSGGIVLNTFRSTLIGAATGRLIAHFPRGFQLKF